MLARMLILVLALASLAQAQTALVLGRTARIEPGTPLTLDDIARLTGPDADRLGSLVLIESPGAEPTDKHGWFRVEIDRVLARLTEELGESAGMIALSGSACDVRVLTPAPLRTTPDAPSSAPGTAPDARPLIGLKTVRGAIARELTRILHTPPESMRLGFHDEDQDFLDISTVGRIIEVTPTGSSERMPVAIAVYDPSGRITRKTIRITVELHRSVAVIGKALPRGAVIEAQDISAEIRWLPPNARVVTPEVAVGSVTRRRLAPGETVETNAVEPPIMVHKGDMVLVRVVTTGLIVRREGNALRDGLEGEVIEFAARHNPNERFRATVVGRGAAVVWVGSNPGTPVAKTTPAG